NWRRVRSGFPRLGFGTPSYSAKVETIDTQLAKAVGVRVKRPKRFCTRSTAILAVGPAGILPADKKTLNQARRPGCPTGKMPVLRLSKKIQKKVLPCERELLKTA